MDLDDDAVFTELWASMKNQCEQLVGAPLVVLRQYANGHTFGQGGSIHTDDRREGCFTLLYYPMAQWEPAWEGETAFYQNQQAFKTITPKPNRAVLFDARIPHVGRAPSRACTALCISMAYKLITEQALANTPIPVYQLIKPQCSDQPEQGSQLAASIFHARLSAALALDYHQALNETLVDREVNALKHALQNHSLDQDDVELRDIAQMRLRTKLRIAEVAMALGYEPGSAFGERKAFEHVMARAKITTVNMTLEQLEALDE
jgi:AraC-like DNA-binding protein